MAEARVVKISYLLNTVTPVILKKENWILAQNHRHDAIGQLARAWVEATPRTIPLSRWLNGQCEVWFGYGVSAFSILNVTDRHGPFVLPAS